MYKQVKRIVLLSVFLILLICVCVFILFRNINLNDVDATVLANDVYDKPTIGKEHAKDKIVIFADFKCPFCKKLDTQVLPHLKNKYVDSGKANIKVLLPTILGKDSKIAAKAGYAIYMYYPEKYYEYFQKIFSIQPNNEGEWINERLIDNELEKLNIPKEKLEKIKVEYKKKNSITEKEVEEDNELYRKFNNQYVPSVYVNGEFVDDPYNIKSFEDKLE
ncbi:DsbA family protein [Staphylococcus chromogenes]|uniref:DsbA family protein n=1 Tax=Staphylococcus chromogenes TaxID=46126 RepID=UPI00288847D5|nr:DsbA family protein [Staphylococcus chromogenes]MDT0715535.1 DsbA family protein [Staphylococcus chromogenes]